MLHPRYRHHVADAQVRKLSQHVQAIVRAKVKDLRE